MPALAVPAGAEPDSVFAGGPELGTLHRGMEASESNTSSALQEGTDVQPSKCEYEGSSAGNSAIAPRVSEQPQDTHPVHSSSGSEPESSQAQAGPQAQEEHPYAEQEAEEHSSKELHPGTSDMDKHVNGCASPQDSSLQLSQEARAVLPAKELQRPSEAEIDIHDSMVRQPGVADSAAEENGKPSRHDDQVQTAQKGEEPECHATHSRTEPPVANSHAKCQTSNTVRFLGNGLQDLQQGEGGAAAPEDPSSVSVAGHSVVDAPDITQAAEQPEPPPQHAAHATSAPEGTARAAGTEIKPEDINVITEISDEDSSEDEHITYPDLPALVPKCFSDSEDDDDTDEKVFTFPAGMVELVLKGGLHPVRIPLLTTQIFMDSGQDDSGNGGSTRGRKASAEIPAPSHPPKPSEVSTGGQSKQEQSDTDRGLQDASVPEGDGDAQNGYQATKRADSMPKAKESPKKAPVLARCALRPGVAAEEQCDKAGDAFAIQEGQRYLKVTCTEGCTITYHFTCWRRFERVYRLEHPDFSWKSKEGVQCFTDGCTGQVKLAQELEEEAGIDTHRRELLRLPDLPRKRERPQPPPEQPEPRRGRRKGPTQKAPEPGRAPSAGVTEGEALPAVQQERVADRPAAVPANTNVEEKQEPLPKPDRVPALDALLIPRQEDDNEDLERLAAGLKGKKEKRRREKRKEKGIIQLSGLDQDSKQQSSFDNFEHERSATPPLDAATFPKIAGPHDAPDLATGEDPLWDLLISMKSCVPAEHVLIWHVDTHSLARRGVSASDELYRLLSLHGRIASLEVYLQLSAAAVSFVRTQDAQKALYAVEGHQLERKKLRGCFLSEFPGDQSALTQKLRDSQAKPAAAAPASAALQTDQAAEMRALMDRESQNLPSYGRSGSEGSMAASHISLTAQPQEGAAAVQPTISRASSRGSGQQSPTRLDRVDMQSVQRGAEALGLLLRAAPSLPSLPGPQASLSIAAPEYRPGTFTQSSVLRNANHAIALASAASQASMSSEDPPAASWPMHSSQLDVTGRAMSSKSEASSFTRADSAASDAPPRPPPPMLPGLDQLAVIQVVGCTRETLATFRQFQADGGFATPTTDLGPFNELLDADCTGLLMYENESQTLHGLWKSTQVANAGAERLVEFELLAEMAPLQGRVLLGALQTHNTGELKVPQSARGMRLQALLPLLRPGVSPAPTPGSGAGKLDARSNPYSKPYSPFPSSGFSTPSTAAGAAASNQQSTAATMTEVAERLTPRSHSQTAQQVLPAQARTNTEEVCQASEDREDGPGSETAGIGAAAVGLIFNQAFTKHAEDLRASIERIAGSTAGKPPSESTDRKAEPQLSKDSPRPPQEGRGFHHVKRPLPEVLPSPGILPVHSAGQTTPQQEVRSTVSTTALSAPVSVQSSLGQTPVQVPQPPQAVAQLSTGVPAKQTGGNLTTGKHCQLSPPAGAAQQASSAPQAASVGREQPQTQMAKIGIPGDSSSAQQHPPGALPGTAKQLTESVVRTAPAPGVPVRRVPLPKLTKLPKPPGSSSTFGQSGGPGGGQLSALLSNLLPKEAPKASAASDQSSSSKRPQPSSKPQPNAPQVPSGVGANLSVAAAAQPRMLPADAQEASGPDEGLQALRPSPSRTQPASKGSAGSSEGGSGSRADSGRPQVPSLQELNALKQEPGQSIPQAQSSISPRSQAGSNSKSAVQSSADPPAESPTSSAFTLGKEVQLAKKKKKRKEYALPAAPAAAQPLKPVQPLAPSGPWASGPPAALVQGDSSRVPSEAGQSPISPLTPAAGPTVPQVSQPQGLRAGGPPTAQRPAGEVQEVQPSQSPVPAGAAEPHRRVSTEDGSPRARPKPEYRPPDVSGPSESSPQNPAPAASPVRPQPPARKALPLCTLCKKEKPGHVMVDCNCLGPCHSCVPSPDRIDLYPECLSCHTKVSGLIKVFL